MTPLVIAQLIASYGLPLAQQLWTWYQTPNKVITQVDWDLLTTLSQYRSSDSLKAAGIQVVDDKVVPI